jgi:Fe-S-cluster containining protein
MIDCAIAMSCKGGFECCGIFPINDAIIRKFPPDQKHIKNLFTSNGVTVIKTIDDLCVYLDRNNGLCSIYEHRPNICRAYGMIEGLLCHYIRPNGTLRNRAERREIKKNTPLKYRQGLRKFIKIAKDIDDEVLIGNTDWQELLKFLNSPDG